MKRKKLLKRLALFLDADRRAQREQANAIREVLKQLKQKEARLREKLDQAHSPEQRQKLETRLMVCHAQRKKGVAILKEIQHSQALES